MNESQLIEYRLGSLTVRCSDETASDWNNGAGDLEENYIEVYTGMRWIRMTLAIFDEFAADDDSLHGASMAKP